ncbi:lipase [Microbispora sp. NPDC046933]|uniref:alpha/beta hydrolase family protein n=1 Tax=Microbispora sp. NPDC046933 TaxID=3155618 RepID=UPI0033D1A1E7
MSPHAKTGLLACAAAVLTVVTAAAEVAINTPGAHGAAVAQAARAPLQLTLPAPTGQYRLGTVSLHLVDPSRPDALAGSPARRELMISLTYPARDVSRHPSAPWISPKAGAEYLREQGLPPGAVLLPVTHAHEGAPADRRHGRLPVVLYSPGNNAPRSTNTIVVEDLASRGYVVVTIGHTYDGVVEFPGGRVVPPAPDGPATGPVIFRERVADTRFVLDTLAVLDAGGNPDAGHRPLPSGLRGLLDLGRVGMFGHSAGGATVASAMFEDRRIKAGLSLDGPIAGPVVTAGLKRPYMLMSATKALREELPDLATFWSKLKGWKLNIRSRDVAHGSYTDAEVLTAQAARPLGLTESELAAQIGTLAPERVTAIQQAYPAAFFDLHLRHRGHLLDGPSPRFPEVTFVP